MTERQEPAPAPRDGPGPRGRRARQTGEGRTGEAPPARRVRPVGEGDWDAIVLLESAAYTPLGLSEGRDALRSRARVSPGTCFVLELAEPPAECRVAGYLLALPYPRFRYPDLAQAEGVAVRSTNLHLHDLVVAEDLRGRGLATALLTRLLATARDQGYRTVSLVAVGGSAPFWAARGFTRHSGVRPPQGYGPGARYMSRPVPPGPAADDPDRRRDRSGRQDTRGVDPYVAP